MAWNFNYMIPSLIFLASFLFFYFLKPIFLTKSNHCFLGIVIGEIFRSFLEVFACIAYINSLQYSRNFILFINNIYFIVLLFRYFIISLYFASIFQINVKKDIPSIITIVAIIIMVIAIMLNPWTNFIYCITDEGKYKRVHYLFFYSVCIITILNSLYYIIRFRRKLRQKEFLISIFIIIALSGCSLVDIFLNSYLIVDMLFVIIITGLFFVFENPEIMFDIKTELLNTFAFTRIVPEYLNKNKDLSLICFVVKNYDEKRQMYGTKQMNLLAGQIGKFFLSQYLSRKCFYLRNGAFVILEKNTKEFSKIRKIVEKRFDNPWYINNTEIYLDIITIETEDNIKYKSIDEIAGSFTKAFHDALSKSINYITVNKKLYTEIAKRTKVTAALHRALTEDDLQVYLQPIVEASTRKVIAAEALVRIYDKDLGLIPPVEFINMAEKNGCIEQLGEQVLNKVCIYLKKSNIYKYGIKWINVNLSPIQCQNKNLRNKINKTTQLHSIDHKYIHFEITEESMIDMDVLKNQMDNLFSDGYNFSLDDFGTGFSNFARIDNFPFNNVKLDISIVNKHCKKIDELIPLLIKTFNETGLSVTAEGIETKETADILENMGCDYLQGYYFSKPMPAEEFEDFLKAY